MGNVKLNDTVVRDKIGIYAKYSVGFEEYAGSTYQPYCSGGAYILSSDVVGKLLPYIKQHPFSIGDVFVGMDLTYKMMMEKQNASISQT